MNIYDNTRRLVAFDVTEGITMGCSSPGVEGALWYLNDRRAEGSVLRAGEAWTCAYFLFLGATEPEPKNQETQMTVAGVPMYWSQELF